ncbi:MAG: TIGR03915 family putative DNA repair protein [Cellvibrio sp.]|uniref:TIGR03915 family putative DNA repair protein n=1 Tax=Cellvibrio sp. TaxID=1965322 RepID=UPI0031AA4DEC
MVFIYDGSYEGLLSCIFVIFKERKAPVAICTEERYQFTLLDEITRVASDDESAARVIKGLDERTNGQASALIYKLFLSELPESEMLVYQVIQAIIQKGDESILENFANPSILKAAQIEKMIHREVHRMHAFVRFQKSRDGLFYSAINPDFNVLPLIGDHFERRYADQHWLIFDTKRHYGLYYDRTEMKFVDADDPVFTVNACALEGDALQDEREKEYQALWKNYFQAVNINERNNKKLHLRHMPRRYWKYLTEKL